MSAASHELFTIVEPINYTDLNLIASNVAESEAEWSSSATYSKGDRVRVGHVVYQSAIDSNTNKNPVTNIDAWGEVGPTNRWAALDGYTSSKTAQANSITYQFRFGEAATALHILDTVGANKVRVYVVDPVYGTVFDQTKLMNPVPLVTSWWHWFFGKRQGATSSSFDLPTFPNADIFVEIEGTADLAVGTIIAGNGETYSLAGVRAGASIGIQDYSRKERTDFGDTTLVKRNFAKRGSFAMMVRASEVDAIMFRMQELRATPCLFIASYRYDSTKIFGFYKDFDLLIEYYDYSVFSINVEGLT